MNKRGEAGMMLLRKARLVAIAAVPVACVVLAHLPGASRAEASLPVDEKVAAILSLAADAAYGEYLAGDCVTCHRRGGGVGIPAIAGLPADHLVKALVEYRQGIRENQVMTIRAARLGDEEIAALAAHFSAQTP